MWICDKDEHCIDCPKNYPNEECEHYIEVQVIKHGRWIKITNDWVDDAQYVCSCCGRLLTVSNRLTELVSMSYPYCHCGAKMDGKEEKNATD